VYRNNVPILRDFERRLGGMVEGLFSKAFRSGVQPVEIAKRVMREMEAGRSVGISEVWAPNRFELSLSSEDAARYEQAKDAIASELRRVIRESAAERGWGLVGPPEVEFVVDERLRRGDLECVASLVEGEDDDPTAASRASVVVREGGGERTVALASDTVTIGRQADCDVVLKDKGASRKHAQLKLRDGVWTLTDLGSTNGTRLNGHTIQSRELADGDKITIGTTVVEFRRD
jgi:FHA domain-containing protein